MNEPTERCTQSWEELRRKVSPRSKLLAAEMDGGGSPPPAASFRKPSLGDLPTSPEHRGTQGGLAPREAAWLPSWGTSVKTQDLTYSALFNYFFLNFEMILDSGASVLWFGS